MAYKEYLLSTNSFKKPTAVSGTQAMATLIVRLLLLEPGTDPIHPEMGVGLVSRYRFLNDSSASDLRDDLSTQLATYIPEAQNAEISFKYNDDKTVDISIVIGSTEYIYDSSTSVPITLDTIKNS